MARILLAYFLVMKPLRSSLSTLCLVGLILLTAASAFAQNETAETELAKSLASSGTYYAHVRPKLRPRLQAEAARGLRRYPRHAGLRVLKAQLGR